MPASGVDQRVGGSLSETDTSGWSGLPRWLRRKPTSKMNEADTATTAQEEQREYSRMISQYDDLVESYYNSANKGLYEGKQSDEEFMIGSRMYHLHNELEDAERERRLSVEQITKLQSSRFKERVISNNYWNEVVMLKINEKLAVYEEIVNRTENIEDMGEQLLPTMKWVNDNITQFTRTQHVRIAMLNDQFKEKLNKMINEKLAMFEEIVNRTEKAEDIGDQFIPILKWLTDPFNGGHFTAAQGDRLSILKKQILEKLKKMKPP